MVTDVQFGHSLCVYQNMMHYRKLPVGYSERYHTVVSTYRIILCFSYILTENRLARAVTDVRREIDLKAIPTTQLCD